MSQNILQLEDIIKGLPDAVIQKDMQAPSGQYPQFLLMSEMKRRAAMRDSAVSAAPTTTVAEDMTAGLGSVPQQQAPTAMMRTGAYPVGGVVKMAEGVYPVRKPIQLIHTANDTYTTPREDRQIMSLADRAFSYGVGDGELRRRLADGDQRLTMTGPGAITATEVPLTPRQKYTAHQKKRFGANPNELDAVAEADARIAGGEYGTFPEGGEFSPYPPGLLSPVSPASAATTGGNTSTLVSPAALANGSNNESESLALEGVGASPTFGILADQSKEDQRRSRKDEIDAIMNQGVTPLPTDENDPYADIKKRIAAMSEGGDDDYNLGMQLLRAGSAIAAGGGRGESTLGSLAAGGTEFAKAAGETKKEKNAREAQILALDTSLVGAGVTAKQQRITNQFAREANLIKNKQLKLNAYEADNTLESTEAIAQAKLELAEERLDLDVKKSKRELGILEDKNNLTKGYYEAKIKKLSRPDKWKFYLDATDKERALLAPLFIKNQSTSLRGKAADAVNEAITSMGGMDSWKRLIGGDDGASEVTDQQVIDKIMSMYGQGNAAVRDPARIFPKGQ